MIDQNIVNYINQQSKAGYDINTIKNALTQQGFNQKDIQDSINQVYNPTAKPQEGGDKMAINMANPTYKGFWIRFVAAFLDSLIIGIPISIISWGLTLATGILSLNYVVQLAAVVLVVYMDGIKGGTPGKLILGMRIVNEKGEYIGIPMAILRYIGKILSGIILGIGFFMIGWDAKKQGLHDKITKTYVVKV